MRQLHSHSLAALALVAASIDARMEDPAPPAAPKNEAEFISQFAAKMEATEKAAADGTAAAVADAEEEEELEEGGDDQEDAGDGDEEDGDGAADDAAGGGDDEGEDGDDADDEGGDADEDEGVEEGKDGKDGKKVDELATIAERLGLAPLVKDLPDALRPIAAKRLKDMDAHFTRTMQKATDFRAEKRQFESEERYRKEHPVEWLAEQILNDPTLEEKVAAQLEKLQADPTIREAAKTVAKDQRKAAADEVAKAEKAEQDDATRREERGTKVLSLAKAACTKNGIQFDRGVESAIAFEIMSSEDNDIDDDRIAEIVEEMAVERGRSKRAIRREAKKEIVKSKTEAAKNASKLKPGQGRAGGSTRPSQKDMTLEQKLTATAERLFPGEK